MRKEYRFLLLLLTLTVLSACTKTRVPVIEFIGMSTGTLETDTAKLSFQDRFAVEEVDLVGVVSFSDVQDGTTVQATWFSPDDRRMPLGRTNIITEDGARIARFSFARTQNWDPAPYMLQIHAWSERDPTFTTSGSVRFFIGLSDEEVAAYWEEYQQWEEGRK